MFTVHHQPQLALWLKEQEKPHKLRAIMEKERKAEFLRLAEEKGYLQTPTKESILKKSRTKTGRKATKLLHVELLRMSAMKFMNLGEVGACSRLKVCIMPGNYLTHFDVLANCQELVKIDLHSNQITTLPGPDFWAMLPKLKAAYLHNNSIGRLECLQNMSTSPVLQVLTLYDTPISLKKSYRHHVVNSVWSLKALDFHVISDEEIIEDAIFGGHFSTMHPALKYNPIQMYKKDSTLEEELASVDQVLSSVTAIQGKHSPVIIIQRYVRGYLIKKRYRMYQDARVWASVRIQRYWRRYKGFKYTAAKSTKLRAASARNLPPDVLTGQTPSVPPPTAAGGPKQDTSGGQRNHLDYDTYLKNRRPGSKSPSVMSSMHGPRRMDQFVQGLGEQEEKYSAMRSSSPPHDLEASPVRRRTNLHIDLTTLETETSNLTCPDPAQAVVIETMVGVQESIDSIMNMKPGEKAPEPAKVKRLREKREKREKRKEKMAMKTVQQMLGPLTEDILEREHGGFETDDVDDAPTTKFRISGLKTMLHAGDPFQEMVILKQEIGRDIRHCHQELIDKFEKPKPKPIKTKRPNADQRIFARVQGTMGMSCLRAVQQAYRDREKAEKHASKQDYIARIKEQREEGKRRANNILEDRRLLAIKQRDIDLNEIAESLERQVTREKSELESRKQRRSMSSEINRNFKKEIQFSTEFIGQQTSISNALQKHDRNSKFDEELQNNTNVVQSYRDNQESQMDLVKRYLEHRKLMRQAQVAVERAALDTRMLQEANERMLAVRSRMDKQKQKSESMKKFFPLPKAATAPVLPPVQLEGKPDKWHTLIAMYDGRVGNYPTLVNS